MQSTITIVNVKDINLKKNELKDTAKVWSETHNGKMDVFLFENEKTGERWKGTLIHVSLYDDVIVRGEEKFKILHMLTKG